MKPTFGFKVDAKTTLLVGPPLEKELKLKWVGAQNAAGERLTVKDVLDDARIKSRFPTA